MYAVRTPINIRFCHVFLLNTPFVVESKIGTPRVKHINISVYFLQVCSAKNDDLFVEAEVFYHFRGLILCNPKRLQFHRNKKIKNIVAHFSKSSIQLCLPFFNLCSCWFRLRGKTNHCCYGFIDIFDGCWITNMFHTN